MGKPAAKSSSISIVRDDTYLQSIIPKRIQMFELLKNQQNLHHLSISGEPIKVTLTNGTVKVGKKWATTPFDIAKELSKCLATDGLVAQVNGVLWDMSRPLESDCQLKIFTFDSDEGRDTFWHSSAHILGQALEQTYGCKLCIGPCTTRGEGFFYDAFYGELGLNDDHFDAIVSGAKKAVAEKQPFERIEVSRKQALEMFSDNKFKVEIISDLPEDKTITVYRCGPLVDLCRGPNIPNTAFVKAIACLKASAAYWRGKKDRESLQRVYGISYPDQRRLKVDTPNIFNMKLWETSGHAANYKENMFIFKLDNEDFVLKPMNCPGHCVIFDHRPELPLRLADFGVLHHNEASGALTGLTRSAICAENLRPEKYLGDLETWDKAEMALADALKEFGKPWQACICPGKRNEGDGAFYGQKIDISVSDAMKRKCQCATLQLDFQLPKGFNLTYIAEDESKRERPVMIHRAILGSVERMFAILLEHYKGKWPFWLSPRQAIVCPLSNESQAYGQEEIILFLDSMFKLCFCLKQVKELIDAAGYYVDIDSSDRTIQKKVREAQLAQYNYILVVGKEEVKTKQVSVRVRDKQEHSVKSIPELLKHFKDETYAFH
ncbi:threonine--tRNA ligase, mitochondrial 1 [Artemisia annua]|uniref:threonine--tRNA ligase n=1 Tax=Artemisia annua TaxID=35608 RepID=A0A2U1N844_ARTAN|nr:threonine--tRNA ligase, mitochondrial 1 [Artemisia annua]